MNSFTIVNQLKALICSVVYAAISLGLSSLLVSCHPALEPIYQPGEFNSRYNDEQPALSGSGRFVSFVTNREGSRNLVLYDLQRQQFIELPYLNRPDAIAERPSISNNARYIVYIASDRARPEVELYDRVTGQVQILSAGYRGWVRNPSISPDGRYISFETGIRGQWDIEVIDRGTWVELDEANEQSS